MARILSLMDARHSKNAEERADAETSLHQLAAVQSALESVLNEPEAYIWDGAAVKGRDILDILGQD